MATTLLEEEISCCICLEIFDNPHVLRDCLHTFCLKCIKQLERKGRVQCPECRVINNIKSIKKDFKMQKFIDLHEKHQIGKNPPGEQKCEFCQAVCAVFRSHCADCDLLLCAGCVQGHKASKALRTHTIEPISALVKTFQSKYQSTIGELEKQVKVIDRRLQDVSKAFTRIQDVNTRQVGDVRKLTQEVINSLKEREKGLEKVVNDANKNSLDQLKRRETELQQQKKDLQSKLALWHYLIESQDVKTLQDSAESVTEDFKEDVKKIKEKMQNSSNPADVASPITVRKGDKWSIEGSIEVITGPSGRARHGLVGIYRDLWTKTLTEIHCEQLVHHPRRLRLIESQLWCIDKQVVNVYNQDCQPVREISHEQVNNARSLVQTPSGQIAVACCGGGGLHLLDHSGEYLRQVTKGSFSDIDCFNGELYGLDCKRGEVVVFHPGKDSGDWKEVRQFKLRHKVVESNDKLCVNNAGTYVSSWSSHAIYMYNARGELRGHTGEKGKTPGRFNCPVLCDMDGSGHVLVADHWNERLQQRDTAGEWHEVTLPGVACCPLDAVLGDGDHVWVIRHGVRTSLLKYKIS